MEIAFKGVPVYAGVVIAAVGYKVGESHCGIRKVVDVESHVLYQHRSACRTRSAAVAVGVRAAIHAGGVVGHNAAHHGRTHRCRIGVELSAIRAQDFIDTLAYYAGLQGDCLRSGTYGITFPALLGEHQHGVGDSLSAETRACRTERHRRTCVGCRTKNVAHLPLCVGTHHKLRKQPVKSCVGAPCEPAQSIGVNLRTRFYSAYFFKEGLHCVRKNPEYPWPISVRATYRDDIWRMPRGKAPHPCSSRVPCRPRCAAS